MIQDDRCRGMVIFISVSSFPSEIISTARRSSSSGSFDIHEIYGTATAALVMY